MIKIQSIIFDLDGTLVDTETTASLAVKECFQEKGISLTSEDTTYVVGRTWASSFGYLSQKYKLGESQNEVASAIKKKYRAMIENHLPTIPGSVEAVTELVSHYKIGLVSGSEKQDIMWVLNKLGIQKYFQVILGAQDYSHSKPSPVGYLKALSELQTSPQNSLVFEDSEPGIESAKKAGSWVVAVQNANRFGHDQSQAHLQIQDFTKIDPKWVQNLTKLIKK